MKDKDFQITFKDRKNFGNYANLYESKIIVGYSSTMLREAFEFKKKVLCLDFAKVDNIDFPSNGICLLEDKSYDSFEKRISKILNMNYESYLDEIEDINSIYNSKFDALQFLKNEIKRW